MSATRTQVYLRSSQRSASTRLPARGARVLASVVREAVEQYIAQAPVDPTSALESTFGAAPEAQFPERDDWEARADRLTSAERSGG